MARKLRDNTEKIPLEPSSTGGFPGETAILSKRGVVPISEIKIGDQVMTHNSRWKPVLNLVVSRQPTVRLYGYGNTSIESACGSQFYARQLAPLITKSGKYGRHKSSLLEPERIAAKGLAEKDASTAYSRVRTGITWASPTVFPRYWRRMPDTLGVDAESDAFFYMIGRWLGDGWIRRNKCIRICANLPESDHLFKELKKTGLKWSRHNHSESVEVMDCYSVKLVKWMRSNFKEHAENKTLPAWIYTASETQRRSLLKGYSESDGHLRKNNSTSASSVSRCLAVGVRMVCHSLGMPCSISSSDAKESPRGDDPTRMMQVRKAFHLHWRVDAEWDKAYRTEFHLWGRVREISEGVGSTDIFDLAVADDNSFVADGQVVFSGVCPIMAKVLADANYVNEGVTA